MKLFIEATPLTEEKLSGIGHTVLETLRAYDKKKIPDLEVIAFVPLGLSKKLKRFNLIDVKIKELPFTHKFFSLFTRFNITPPVDVVLGKGVYIFLNYRNLSLLFSKSVTFVHDVSFFTHPQYTQVDNLRYLRRHITKWLRRTDRVATISESSKSEIEEFIGVDDKDITVLPLGCDKDVFYPKPKKDVEAIKNKYEINGRYCVCIGNIEPRKNLSFLAESFAASGYEGSLVLVGGNGWRNEPIHKSIMKVNKVHPGKINRIDRYVPDEDLPDLISGADVLFLPSHHEGFGLSAAQAVFCDTPVVASDIPSLKEVGKGCYNYFRIGSSTSFIQAFNYAMSNKIDTKQRNKFINTYNWSKFADGLYKLVSEL